jgi:hypothetical protein
MIWMSWILEFGWLLAVDSLRQVTMEEGIIHAELMNGPLAGQS